MGGFEFKFRRLDTKKPVIPFIKMQGLGNDFVIIDQRKRSYTLDFMKISDRKFGIGCDQIILIEESEEADCLMRIYNADGSEVAACGNATRCIAKLVMQENKISKVTIAIQKKILRCWDAGQNIVKVDMGKPLLNWYDIPLSANCDTNNLPIFYEGLGAPSAVNIGNPHVVFFVENIDEVDLVKFGPQIENDLMFPEKVNVNIAQITNKDILLKVWERGVGETLACGSGACATLVAAIQNGYISDNNAVVIFRSGELHIEWSDSVFMKGSVAQVFTGIF